MYGFKYNILNIKKVLHKYMVSNNIVIKYQNVSLNEPKELHFKL